MNQKENAMNVLFVGAGVVGSLYAAHLAQAGQRVNVLARGQRAAWLSANGIIIEQAISGHRSNVRVNVVETLRPEDAYDLIVVAVRKNQVDSVLPMLGANHGSNAILFMVNNPSGYDEWVKSVGSERLLIGYSSSGGTIEDNIVRYTMTPGALQPTTFGENTGNITPRLRKIAAVFKAAGFPVALCRNMDAWQKTHVAWTTPIAQVLYKTGCDHKRLGQDDALLRLLVCAVREGFDVVRALGYPIMPARLKALEYMPLQVLVAALRLIIPTSFFETVFVQHVRAARDEMAQVAEEFYRFVDDLPISTPAIDRLRKEAAI